MCPAEDLTGDAPKDFDDFRIRKLIRQTGVRVTLQAITRWQCRFNSSRANLPATSIRLMRIVDGLNQLLEAKWGRWLGRAALKLNGLGGCLLLTTRT